MRTNEFDQLKKEEKKRSREQTSNRFWRAFLFTENGKVKSTLMLNSFCMCVVFLVVYAAAFGLLLDPLHALVGSAPTVLVNLVEALVPAVVGTGVCTLAWPLFREKRMLLATYLWLALLAAACFVTMLILLGGESQAQLAFLQFFVLFVPAPLLTGFATSALLYRRHWKRRVSLPAETETWKRN